MIVFASRPRMQEHKGQETSDRRNLWRSEEQSPRITRERRRPVEPLPEPSIEEMEMECERWDGLS